MQQAQPKPRHRHDGAGIARAHESIGLPGADQFRSHVRRTVLLLAEGVRGRVIHGDHFTRRHDFNGQPAMRMLGQFFFQLGRKTHQKDAHAKFASSRNGALDLRTRRIVSSHCVYRYGYH